MQFKGILFAFTFVFSKCLCDIEDIEPFLSEPFIKNKELLRRKPWLTWSQKLEESQHIKMHETDKLFNVTVKDKTFFATYKDLRMWLTYTHKLIVIKPKNDNTLKIFLKIYTNIYKLLYEGNIKYIRGENSAVLMTEFEQLGKDMKTYPSYERNGDCNFITSLLDKFAFNNTMFIIKNSTPNNYVINRLNIHMKQYPHLRALIISAVDTWNPIEYHFLQINNYISPKYQNNHMNPEFLSPDGITDIEYLQNLKAPKPMQVEDFVEQFMNKRFNKKPGRQKRYKVNFLNERLQ